MLSVRLKALINRHEINDGSPLFHCSICDASVSSKEEWVLHVNGNAHGRQKSSSSNLDSDYIFEQLIAKTKHLLADQSKFVVRDDCVKSFSFTCVLCDTKLQSYFTLAEHIRQNPHDFRVKKYYNLKESKNTTRLTKEDNPLVQKQLENQDQVIPAKMDEKRVVDNKAQSGCAKQVDDKRLSADGNLAVSAVQHLCEFFSGHLKCLRCEQLFPLEPSLIEHCRSCLSQTVNSTKLDHMDVKTKFIEYITKANSQKAEALPNNAAKLRTSPSIFRQLDANVLLMAAVAARFFNCLCCDITADMSTWKVHLLKKHLSATFSTDLQNGVVNCICVMCNTLLFGPRHLVAQHSHFNDTAVQHCFSLAAYPHLNAVLRPDDELPRYYKFLIKLASTDFKQPATKMAFYCLPCDFYGMENSKKHFQSCEHRSNVHPTFEFRYCNVCSILFYSDQLLFNEHHQSPSHVFRAVKTSTPKGSVVSAVSEQHELMLVRVKTAIALSWTKYQPKNNFERYAFWCEPCTYITESQKEWRKSHLSSDSHTSQLRKNSECFEHVCLVCKVNIFGGAELHAAHSASAGHENIKSMVFHKFNCRRMRLARKNSSAADELSDVEQVSSDDENVEKLPSTPVKKVTSAPPANRKKVSNKADDCDLETEPYVQKLHSTDAPAEKIQILRGFLQKLVQRHGPFRKLKNYFCSFCNRYFSSDKSWWSHLKTLDHESQIKASYKDSKSTELDAVFCYHCLSLSLGPKGMRSVHEKTALHRNRKVKATPKAVKSVSENETTASHSPFMSTTDEEEEAPSNSVPASKTSLQAENDSRAEMGEDTNSEEGSKAELNEADEEVNNQLYDMLVQAESDASEEELNKTLVDEVKNCIGSSVEEEKKLENESDTKENVEHCVVVKGIPLPVLKNKKMIGQTFEKFVQFERTFTKKNEPGSLYLVVAVEPEESYQKLKKNLQELKTKLGTDELSVDYNTTKTDQSSVTGIREHLSPEIMLLFTNPQELNSGVHHLIRKYDDEANSPESNRRIWGLQDILLKLATYIYRNYKAMPTQTHVFGSRVTGLASENSDVDIYLQIGNSFRGLIHNNLDLQQQLVVLFSKEMARYPLQFQNIIAIPFARVPIVKFTHLATKLNCDLSFKSGLSTMNSLLVRTYLEMDERIKFVICAVKLWMKLNDLADRTLFTTYAQIWMVLFFLMQPDIAVVPTVLSLKLMLPNGHQKFTVEGWNCSFPNMNNIRWRSKCPLSEEELLHKFFLFYSDRSLINYVLCTLTGVKIEKKHFLKNPRDLPTIFTAFQHKIHSDPFLFRKVVGDFDGLCVQDPFDHCHNLTKTINTRRFASFVDLCKQTTELLSQ